MHATQHQGGLCPDPRTTLDSSPAGQLAGLLTDDTRFRAWISQAVKPATTPAAMPAAETDRDGYVVTDAGLNALADNGPGEAPGTAGRVLRSAAVYLQRYGWIQGAYYDNTSPTFTPAACLVGAIGMVCYGGPVDAPAQHFDDPGYLDFEEAVLHLDRYLLAEDGTESYKFNDAKGRQLTDVLHVLHQAAGTPADELIDAIRAIDAHNTDMAALAETLTPAGAFADTTTVPDCPACDQPLIPIGAHHYWCGTERAHVTVNGGDGR